MLRFLASAIVASLVISSSFASIIRHADRQAINIEDVIATFKIVQSASSRGCPNIIVHETATNPLSHADIKMNNKDCQDGQMEFLDDPDDVLATISNDRGEVVVQEIQGIDSDNIESLIFAVERNGRQCGTRGIDNIGNNTLIVVFRVKADITTATLNVRSDFIYMYLFSASGMVCRYQAPAPKTTPAASATPSSSMSSPQPSTSVESTAVPTESTLVVPPTPSEDEEEEETGVATPDVGGITGTENGNNEAPASPSAEVDQTEEPDDGGVCFPADATVQLENGNVKRMDQVKVGDRIKVGAGVYSDVFMFTHKTANVISEFVTLETESGDSMSATPGHYIYVNDRLVSASSAKVGDYVTRDDGGSSRIVRVVRESKAGLFNPQTVEGNIIVNGLQASTFTQTVEMCAAQAMMMPLRMMYKAFGYSLSALNNGASSVASYLPKGNAVA